MPSLNPNQMQNRFVLVTGGTDGIGKQTAKALAQAGALVTIVGRDKGRGERARNEIAVAVPGGDVAFLAADMGSMASVRSLADEYRRLRPKLDVLIHSAGIIDMERPMTPEGIEKNFAVNYLGRYLLTTLLDDLLKHDSRIIALATAGAQPIRFDLPAVSREKGLSGFRAYQQSQAANDVWGADLADKLRGRGIRVAIVAPGIVKTSIRKAHKAPWWLQLFDILSGPFALSVEKGAETPIRLAAESDTWPEGAVFFGVGMKPLKVSEKVRDPAVRHLLAEASARLAPVDVLP